MDPTKPIRLSARPGDPVMSATEIEQTLTAAEAKLKRAAQQYGAAVNHLQMTRHNWANYTSKNAHEQAVKEAAQALVFATQEARSAIEAENARIRKAVRALVRKADADPVFTGADLDSQNRWRPSISEMAERGSVPDLITAVQAALDAGDKPRLALMRALFLPRTEAEATGHDADEVRDQQGQLRAMLGQVKDALRGDRDVRTDPHFRRAMRLLEAADASIKSMTGTVAVPDADPEAVYTTDGRKKVPWTDDAASAAD